MSLKSNVLLFLENRTEELDNKISLGMKSRIGWKELTYRGLSLLSKRLANYLIKIGINKGDKLAILSESMPEWGAAFFASILSGAISVPLDIKLTIYELTSILTDCQPKVLLASSAFLETALKLQESIPSIEHIVVIDDNGSNMQYPSLYNLPDEPDRKWRHRSPSKTALIIYTSGTTGNPKGVEITFKNVRSQVDAVGQSFNFGPNDQLLSILPMNHLFELTVGFLSFLNLGTSIYYSKSLKPKDLFSIMVDKKITYMVVVPSFLKLLKVSMEAEINKFTPFHKGAFELLYKIAKVIPSHGVRRLLFKQIHKKFGENFKGYITGGAPLDLKVGEFFETIGIRILEAYGLSEASPIVTMSTPKANKMGAVGKALPSVSLKIDEETKELMIQGDNVMKGYYNRPDLTAEVIDENGWLHSGDIANIDKDGFVYITGRIKSMIVLSGGKKVFPEEVESVLEKSPKFTEICVFGGTRSGGQKDGSEDVCIAIVPDEELVKNAGSKEEVEKIIRKEVKLLSERLSPYKRPTSIILVEGPLPRTATRKVKRREVKAAIEAEN